MERTLTCLILSDGRIGTENNARGLAEALGLDYTVKKIGLRQPWKTLSPWLRWGLKHGLQGDSLTAPWPDVVISAGRTPAVGSLYIGQQAPDTLRFHITHAGIAPKHFTKLITPQHDGVSGTNVLTTTGALHRVTAEKLHNAAIQWQPYFAALPRPWHMILIGGDTRDYKLTAAATAEMMRQIRALGGSLIATASRRTSALARQTLAANVDYLWDGAGDNPYLGMLALADTLFVTGDSISMLSEAASTGKPTYLLPLDGKAHKHEKLHRALIAGNHIRPFTGTLDDSWQPAVLNEWAHILPPLQELMAQKSASLSPKPQTIDQQTAG